MSVYASPADVPMFRYGLIMADPAWAHIMRSPKGHGRSPGRHYAQTTPMDDIKALRVADMCLPDAWLWLWVPGCFMDQGINVLTGWGFRFVTMGFWGKVTKSMPVRPHIGTGYVLREAGEPYLIGKVGQPRVLDRGISSLILDPRREPSRKPEQAYAHCTRMVAANTPKLDLFSRQIRDGWDTCGDEAEKFTSKDKSDLTPI